MISAPPAAPLCAANSGATSNPTTCFYTPKGGAGGNSSTYPWQEYTSFPS